MSLGYEWSTELFHSSLDTLVMVLQTTGVGFRISLKAESDPDAFDDTKYKVLKPDANGELFVDQYTIALSFMNKVSGNTNPWTKYIAEWSPRYMRDLCEKTAPALRTLCLGYISVAARRVYDGVYTDLMEWRENTPERKAVFFGLWDYLMRMGYHNTMLRSIESKFDEPCSGEMTCVIGFPKPRNLRDLTTKVDEWITNDNAPLFGPFSQGIEVLWFLKNDNYRGRRIIERARIDIVNGYLASKNLSTNN
jgi:hypothetical protein